MKMKMKNRTFAVLGISVWASSVSAIPITSADTVIVDGTEWVQVDLFTNLSWNDINAACPLGVCIAGSELNGYTMTNLIWAPIDRVNTLFNSYLITAGVSGEDLLGLESDFYTEAGSVWASDFFSSGWRPTFTNLPALQNIDGLTSEIVWDEVTTGVIQWSPSSVIGDQAATGLIFTSDSMNVSNQYLGAWFYRPDSLPTPGIPTPATVALFSLGLAGIGWTRPRKHKQNS